MNKKFKVDGSGRVVDDTGVHVCETFGYSYDPEDIADALNVQEDRSKLSDLDQLAADYFASGRTLKIQGSVNGHHWGDDEFPSFHPSHKWRRKPTTETQTWVVLMKGVNHRHCYTKDGFDHKEAIAMGWRIVGTLTGEVEV